MNKNKFFISTAIPYVNAKPHIGFAMELIQGDVLARYHRLIGEEVRFLNGTDENSLKNVQAAEKVGQDVKDFVDLHALRFLDLNKALNVVNDDFIRTTEDRHVRGAQKLWNACQASGDIYKKSYDGLYCVGCEEFKTEKDLVDGLCPEHKVAPEHVKEENYFFKLSRYQDKILDLLESDTLAVIPRNRKNELIEFAKQGLEDFSISRSRERAKNWGISVPGDESQIMYVWFDALTNYINALGYGSDQDLFESWWNYAHTAHLIGKGITRFHAIYWPAMLLSAAVPLPKTIYVHGYVTVDGEKISKSLGNGADPFDIVSRYGIDPVRYYLLREIPSGDDGDFSYKNLEARYTSDLANGLGNLVQRVATLVENNLDNELIFDARRVAGDSVLKEVLDDSRYKETIDQFMLHETLAEVWKKITLANIYVNDHKPWALVKEDPDKFLTVMTALVAMINHITWLLQPFMPDTARKIFLTFGNGNAEHVSDGFVFRVVKGQILFPRLDL